jgi:hypothetical protein
VSRDAFRLVLACADHDELRLPDVDGRTLDAALRLAQANGLFTAVGRGLERAGRTLPGWARAASHAEAQARASYVRSLELLVSASEDAGRGYALIKNVRRIEHVPRDVDVFVRGADLEPFLAALRARGCRIVADDAEISAHAPGHLRIDLYARIHYLGRDFVLGETLEAARTRETIAGVRTPTVPADVAYALNSIHSVLGHGALSLLDLLDLKHLARPLGDLRLARAHAERCGWARAFDAWSAYVAGLARALDDGTPPAFPHRHGRRFILRFLSLLDGPALDRRERLALGASLLLDDVIFATEGAGLGEAVRRSRAATGVANAAGHRLRTLRGDRKRADGRSAP